MGILGVFKMCRPFNKLRGFLCITTGIGYYAAVALCLWLKNHWLCVDILHMAVPTGSTLLFLLGFAALSLVTERVLALTLFRPDSRLSAKLRKCLS